MELAFPTAAGGPKPWPWEALNPGLGMALNSPCLPSNAQDPGAPLSPSCDKLRVLTHALCRATAGREGGWEVKNSEGGNQHTHLP